MDEPPSRIVALLWLHVPALLADPCRRRDRRGRDGCDRCGLPTPPSFGPDARRQLRPRFVLGHRGPLVWGLRRVALPLLRHGGRRLAVPTLGAVPGDDCLCGPAPWRLRVSRSGVGVQSSRRHRSSVEVGRHPRRVHSGRERRRRLRLAPRRSGPERGQRRRARPRPRAPPTRGPDRCPGLATGGSVDRQPGFDGRGGGPSHGRGGVRLHRVADRSRVSHLQ